MQIYNKMVLKRLSILAIALLPAIALSSGEAIAQSIESDSELTPPPVTKILPKDTAGVLLINTTEQTWDSLNRFNPFPFSLTGPFGLPFLPGINFSTDVQPWLGEIVAIALLPVPTTEDAQPLLPNILMLAPAKDTASLNAFVAKFKESRGETPIEKEYQGITILEWPATELPPAEDVPEICPDSDCVPEENPPDPDELPPADLPETPEETPQDSSPKPSPQSRVSFPKVALPQFALNLLPTQQATKNPPSEISEPSEEETQPAPMPEVKPGLAIAVLPGYLAASTSSAAIEQLIDSQTDIKPLAETPGFKRTLKHPEFGRSLFVGYTNIAAAARLDITGDFPEIPGGLPIPLPSLQLLAGFLQPLAETYDTAEVFSWVQNEGIRSQSSLYYKTPKPENATQPTPDADKILAKLPAATYLSFNSRNFKQQWDNITKASGETGQPFLDSLRQFLQTNLGLDIDNDIIPWMDGEYSLFLFPTTEGLFPYFLPQLKIGVGLIMQTSDRSAAESMLTKLEEFVKTASMGIVTVTRDSENVGLTSWEIPQSENSSPLNIFAHRWTDDNILILTTGKGPMSALNPQPNQSLARFYNFQTATKALPQPNNSSFYLNWGALLSFIYTLVPLDNNSEFVSLGKQFAGTLRSFSFAYSSTPEKKQADAFLVLAPAREQ